MPWHASHKLWLHLLSYALNAYKRSVASAVSRVTALAMVCKMDPSVQPRLQQHAADITVQVCNNGFMRVKQASLPEGSQ